MTSRGSSLRIGAYRAKDRLFQGNRILSGPERHVATGLAGSLQDLGEPDSLQSRNPLREVPPTTGNPQSLFESGPSQACQVRARLLHFGHVWAASIQDFWTIRMVSSGHTWVFCSTPRLRLIPTSLPHSEEKRQILLAYVTSLLEQDTAIPVPDGEQGQGMYSPLFMVQKKKTARGDQL